MQDNNALVKLRKEIVDDFDDADSPNKSKVVQGFFVLALMTVLGFIAMFILIMPSDPPHIEKSLKAKCEASGATFYTAYRSSPLCLKKDSLIDLQGL